MDDLNILNFIADQYDLLLMSGTQRYNMDNEDDRRENIENHHRLFNRVQEIVSPGCFIELGAGRLDFTARLAESMPGTEFHVVDVCPHHIGAWSKHLRPDIKIHNKPICSHSSAARALVTPDKDGTKVELLRTREQCEGVYSTGTQKLVDIPAMTYNSFLSKNKLTAHTQSLKINSHHLTKAVIPSAGQIERHFKNLAHDRLQSLFVMCDETDPHWSSYRFIMTMYNFGFVPLCRSMDRPERSAISFVRDTWKHHPVIKQAMAANLAPQ